MTHRIYRAVCLAFVLLVTSGCTTIVQGFAEAVVQLGIHGARGVNDFNKHQYSRALAEFNTVIAAEPDTPLALEYRGATYLYLRNPRAAIADLDRAEGLLPKGSTPELTRQRAWIYLYRSNAYIALGENVRAEVDLDSLTQINPRYVGAYVNLAEAIFREGRATAAAGVMNRAIALSPSSGILYNNRCFYRAAIPDLTAALRDCNTALKLQKTGRERYFTLTSRAVVYLKLNRPGATIADCNAALKIIPRDPDSLYLRGLAERARGDTADAARDVAEGLARKPTMPTTYAIFHLSG